MKSVQIRSFFWSVFSRIRTEYGDLLLIPTQETTTMSLDISVSGTAETKQGGGGENFDKGPNYREFSNGEAERLIHNATL